MFTKRFVLQLINLKKTGDFTALVREAKFDPLQKEKSSLKTDTAIVFKISLPQSISVSS